MSTIMQQIANQCDLIQFALTPQCESRGKFITSLLGASLSFDKRDDPIDPTRGWRANLSASFAGVGGDVNYYRTQFNGAYYHPLVLGLVGALKLNAGYIDGYGGDDVRLSDRFFQGAGSFRGFEVAGLGPRFLNGGGQAENGQIFGQSIGGKVTAIASGEILVPVPLPKEYGIRVALFSDVGTVGLVDDNTKLLNDDISFFINPDTGTLCTVMASANCIAPVQDDLSLRLSAGVSISWDSPFGPVRFDIAEVFRKEVYDRTEGFRFSAGTSF